MKKLSKIILFITLLFLLSVSAQAKEVFLCMQSEQNSAIAADDDGILEYIELIDSNGAKVFPKISADGNTYLPLRFMFETAGFADGEKDTDSENYFKFTGADPNIPDDRQKIEICQNGNSTVLEVGKEFSYEVSEGDVRTVCVYNVNGSLYFPMTYMAKTIGANTFFCYETGDIIFSTAGIDTSAYIDENAKLLDSAMQKGIYYPAQDENRQSGQYISSDGRRVSVDGISGDIHRAKSTLYFKNESGSILTKNENEAESAELNFVDAQGNGVDVHVEDFLVVKTKIYGIDASSSRVFVSDTDGSGFCYVTDYGAYNLLLREYNRKHYVYYCDKASKSEVHMIEVSTGDNYLVEITDMQHNSLLENIKSFEVEDNTFTYIDEIERIHIINLPDPLEEFEIARIKSGDYSVVATEE